MHVVAKLIRKKIREKHAGGETLRQIVATAPAAPNRTTGSCSSSALPCWLCGEAASTQIQVVEAMPLCINCFQAAFTAFLLPELKKNLMGVQLAEAVEKQVQLELKQPLQSEPRPLHIQSVMSVRRSTSAKPGALPWDCPRCTLINAPDVSNCIVCGATSPHVVTCTFCKQPCGSSSGDRTVCKAVGKEHEVWECERCTVINTIKVDICMTCNSSRTWSCDHCGHANRSRSGQSGEKFCSVCGTMAMSASQRRLFAEEQSRERERVEKIQNQQIRLEMRLKSIGVTSRIQMSDGNCQFRALSHQLLGSPDHHMLVRHLIVEHLKLNIRTYLPYFETKPEFLSYLERMSLSGTWGDELTVKAASEVFGVHVHIISSEEQRWHIVFSPPAVQAPAGGEESDEAAWPEELPHVFVAYVNGCHYDDVYQPPQLPSIGDCLLKSINTIAAEEKEWDEAEDSPKSRMTPSASVDESWVRITK